MMNKKMLILSMLILVVGITTAVKVEVDIKEYLRGEVLGLSYRENGNLIEFLSEFYNTGSVAYSTRARIDITQDNSTVFTGWSMEKPLTPGSKANFNIFWYPEESGNYTVSLRIYFGNEILFHDKARIEIKSKPMLTEAFEIDNIKTYDNEITFNMDTENEAVIIPYRYPAGWIFEQAVKEPGNPGIALNYIPTLWTPNNYLTVLIVSEDGSYYTEKTFKMEKEESDWKSILEIIRSVFNYMFLFRSP